jgi:CHAD domain-containing protein
MKHFLQEQLEKKIQKNIKKIFKYDLEEELKKNKIEPEKIHKFRVSLRRLRSILEEFINEIKIELDLIYDLRTVFRKSGKIRDIDILLLNLEKFFDELKEQSIISNEFEEIKDLLKKNLNKKRDKFIEDFYEYIQSKKYKHLINNLKELKNNINFKNFYLSESDPYSIINLILSKFYKLLSHSYWNIEIYDIKALHHLRRQIKRTRYYMELFKKFYKKNDEYKNIINQLKELQDLSGSIVDFFVLREELEKLYFKNLAPITNQEQLEFTIQNFDAWMQEKEFQLFQQWNSKKNEFYKNQDNYIQIIKENCRIENINLQEIH